MESKEKLDQLNAETDAEFRKSFINSMENDILIPFLTNLYSIRDSYDEL